MQNSICCLKPPQASCQRLHHSRHELQLQESDRVDTREGLSFMATAVHNLYMLLKHQDATTADAQKAASDRQCRGMSHLQLKAL